MQTSSSSNFTYINLFQNTYHPSSLSTKPRPKSVHTATIPLTSFLLYRMPQSEDFTPFKEEILKRLGLLQRQQKLADKFLIDAERWLLVQRTLTRRFHHRYQHVNFKRKLGVTAAPPSPPLLSRSSLKLDSKLSIPETGARIRYPDTFHRRSISNDAQIVGCLDSRCAARRPCTPTDST